MADVIALTKDLLSIPSHEDETEVGNFIEGWLRDQTDATVDRDRVGNVIATRGTGPTSLGLIGHHDVVPPAASQIRGSDYVIEERNGRIYGRGSADMKGALSAMMCAFRDANPTQTLVFASFVGEETGGRGAKHALDSGFDLDRAIVGEGSTNYSGSDVTDVVIAHRGRRESTVTVSGEASHAGEPDIGVNAIYSACEIIERIRQTALPSTRIAGSELHGSATVTTIRSGGATNVVPDVCELTIDERTIPGKRVSLDWLTDRSDIHWHIEQDIPPMECDDEHFASSMVELATRAQQNTPSKTTKPHATDAGWLDQAGIACVVCGPAEPGEAHTSTESVDTNVLERCYRIYRLAGEHDSGENP